MLQASSYENHPIETMRVLIIEDEEPAAERLESLLLEANPQIQVLAHLDSVESSVEYLQKESIPDLIFLDIQLADGLSFEIFDSVTVETPIIFTTAYDQYAIQAFQVNSIDYLLKPIAPESLHKSLSKYQKWQGQAPLPDLRGLIQALRPQQYQERFLIRVGDQLKYVSIGEVAYFMAESRLVLLVTNQGRQFPVDYKIEDLESMVDPRSFYRLNRKFLARLESIQKIHTYFNSRLKIDLQPAPDVEVIISREKVNGFKQWLNS